MWILQLVLHTDAEVLKYNEVSVPEIIPMKPCTEIMEISIFLATKQKSRKNNWKFRETVWEIKFWSCLK